MPFIAITTSKRLGHSQKEALKARLGRDIAIIPGKTEAALMLDICDGHTMYYAGETKHCAYIDVRLYGTAPFEKKEEFSTALFALMKENAGLEPDAVYITFLEYENWGLRGILK